MLLFSASGLVWYIRCGKTYYGYELLLIDGVY